MSHTGTNKQTAIQKNEGTLIVEYVPQGTLAERIVNATNTAIKIVKTNFFMIQCAFRVTNIVKKL